MANMYQFTAGVGNPPATFPSYPQQGYRQPQQNNAVVPYPYGQPNYPPVSQAGLPGTYQSSSPNPLSATNHSFAPQMQTAYQQPRKHSAPTPNAQGCYNCGQFGHIAQHCPEPRRAVPAGSLTPRPPKRQKTGGPIITKYPPPPGYVPMQQPQPQRGYTYPQVGSHAPQVSLTAPPQQPAAVSQPYGNWQQQPIQQSSPVSVPTPTTQWGSQIFPPHSASYNSYVSTPASATVPQNQHGFFPPISPHVASPIGYGASMQGSPPAFANHSATTTPGSTAVATPHQDSISSKPQEDLLDIKLPGEEDMEPWLRELKALDDAYSERTGKGPRVFHPANPVARPLPSTSDAADAIGRLPIAASLPPGVPVSLHFRDLTDKDLERKAFETPEWMSLKDDPIFIEISDTGEVLTVQDLVARRNEVIRPDVEDDFESEDMEHGANEDASDAVKEDSDGSPKSTLEQEYEDSENRAQYGQTILEAERERKSSVSSISPKAEIKWGSKRHHSPGGEDRLRMKRVHSGNHRPSEKLERRGSHRDNYHRENRNGHDRRDSYRQTKNRDRGSFYDRLDRTQRRRSSWDRPPPPPPPPGPPRRSGPHDGPSERSPPRNHPSYDKRADKQSDNPLAAADAVTQDDLDPASLSPAWGNPVDNDNTTRRDADNVEEGDAGPRKQEEEEMPEARKRQPPVAAAYGRRW